MDYFRTVKSLPLQQYLLHDWTAATGMTIEDWAQDLWDRGWRDWCGPGMWITVDGERRFRTSLRREAHYLRDELSEQRAAAARR